MENKWKSAEEGRREEELDEVNLSGRNILVRVDNQERK